MSERVEFEELIEDMGTIDVERDMLEREEMPRGVKTRRLDWEASTSCKNIMPVARSVKL